MSFRHSSLIFRGFFSEGWFTAIFRQIDHAVGAQGLAPLRQMWFKYMETAVSYAEVTESRIIKKSLKLCI